MNWSERYSVRDYSSHRSEPDPISKYKEPSKVPEIPCGRCGVIVPRGAKRHDHPVFGKICTDCRDVEGLQEE